ncbi:C40 family peptidase [Nocardia farcinica]|uniref:C40 family peptidase n=1 Tax=Nocardia farcinica TaxID=37329 RepID=UPI002454ED9E|nr:NlpC/P60 family protein [Nocardia farcinica]
MSTGVPSRQRANAGLDQNPVTSSIIFREGAPSRDPQVLIIALPRTTYDQVHTGPSIPEDQLLPGDLLFYGTDADVHHVSIYLGAGKMLHAPTFNEPVQISEYRWRGDDYYKATRPADLAPPAAGPAPQL